MWARRRIDVEEPLCCVVLVLCLSLHVHELTAHTPSNSVSALQRSLPESRVHYCSLTSASTNSVAFFVFVATECCLHVRNGRWCVRGLAFVCQDLSVQLWVLSPKLCVSMYVCVAGGLCVVLFVLKVFPHSDPRGGSRTERQRERERGRESAFAVPSRPHTNHFILISGN